MRRSIGGKFLVALFVFAIPLFLITDSVTWAVNDLRLYRRGFDKYDVSLATGIEKGGLEDAAREIRGYFNSTREPLDIKAEVFGEERELFSQREVLHMRDVKRLIWGVYGVGAASALYVLGFVAVGFFLYRRLFIPIVARYVLWSGGLTLAVVVLVGLVSLVGFDSLFLFFHRVSFSNDFWMLDPNRDYLVMMFPQGFWFDATILVALVTVAQAAVLGGIAGGVMVLRRLHDRSPGKSFLHSPPKAAGL